MSDLVPEKTRGVLGCLRGSSSSSACAPQKITGVEPHTHTAAIADLVSDRKEGVGKGVRDTGGPSTHSPVTQEGWRPDLQQEEKRADVTPSDSFLSNLSLTSPVCRCNLPVIPSVPVIPVLLQRFLLGGYRQRGLQ